MKYSWNIDSFDSRIFGFKVAKILKFNHEDSYPELRNEVKKLKKELMKSDVRYAVFRAPSNNFPLIHVLGQEEFLLVDGLLNLSVEADNLKKQTSNDEIKKASRSDLNSLENITSGLYSMSRIFNDPIIPNKKAIKFYKEWIRNSILEEATDLVLTWKSEGELLGYISLKKIGQISLLGVSAKARGKGIAKKLVASSLNYFKELKVKTVTVETQMGNIPALRVYQDCGFKIVNSFLTFRWANNL